MKRRASREGSTWSEHTSFRTSRRRSREARRRSEDLKKHRNQKAVDEIREAFEMAILMIREPQFLDENQTETGAIVGRDAGTAV